MKLLNSLTFPLFLIFFLSEPCQAFFQSEYIITDLESLNSTGFTKEASSWAYKGAPCPECIFSLPSDSSCDSVLAANMVFGGPGATLGGNMDFFEREYSLSGPEWYYIGLSYEIWAFTTSELQYASYMTAHKIYWPVLQDRSFSGGEWKFISSCPTDFISSQGSHIRYIYKYQVQFLTTLDLPTKSIYFGIRKSIWEAPESLDSVGLRNLKIYNLTSRESTGYQNFPCVLGSYLNGASCQVCHFSCQSCSGPNSNQCTACTKYRYDLGNGVCVALCTLPFEQIPGTMKCANKCSNSFYWTRNQSCIETCEAPLIQFVSDFGARHCVSPCWNSTEYYNYVYPDGSCSPTCKFSFREIIEPTIKFCVNPCQNSGPGVFLYPDGSCVKTCPPPLIQKTEKNITYCESPCPITARFMYPNRECLSTCDPPSRRTVEKGILLCSSSCDTAEYLYSDGSCGKTCPRLYSKKTENGVQFCENPCPGTGKYIYPDQTCSSTCDPPLVMTTEDGISLCSSPCNLGGYLYQDGFCGETCPTYLWQKTEKNIKYCENPCSGVTKYVNPDQSCSSTCDSLLREKLEHGISSCLSPCDVAEYLYPDGSCAKTCPTLFSKKTKNGIQFCENPCSGGTKYVNPDQSCSSTCDPRLKSNTEHGISSCSNPCDPAEYLYPDGSCDKTCPTPFSKNTEKEIQFCENPCFKNKTFLYEDGACQEVCPSPRIAKEDPSIGKTCRLPCANVDYYYHNRNGTCTKTCEYTSEAIESSKLCVSSLSEEEVKQIKAIADTANDANSASSTGVMIWSFISSSDSTLACLGPLAKMLQYTKFMDIKFPEKVLILMDAQSKDSGAKMMGDVLKRLPSRELPRKFEVYQSSSSFFVNLWPALFNLSMILLVAGLVVGGVAKTKGYPKINGILKSLSEILKWNVFLITFCGSIGDIVLFTALEFQTMQLDSFASVFSFLLCLGLNALVGFVAFKILDVNSTIRKAKSTAGEKTMIEQEWSSYKTLFECYKNYSFYQQIFLFVFLVRLALVNAAIGYLYNYPLLQATTAVVLNILMLGYLIIKRPMKKMVSLIQQIVLELVLLPFNICVLVLAVMDSHGIVDTNLHKSIGEVMVYINVLIPILSLVLLAAKAIIMGFDLYKTWKLAKQNKKEGVQNDCHPYSLKFTEEESSVSSPNKNLDHHVPIEDVTNQSVVSTGQHSAQSNLLKGNQKIGSIFMANSEYDQNSIPMGEIEEETSPQNYNGMMINKKSKDQGLVQNYVLNGGLGSIEEPDL